MNNSPFRLAIFLPALYGGGAERVMLNLGAGLAEQGFSVDLVLAQAEGPYLGEIPGSVRLIELNKRHRKTMRTVVCLPALVRYLRRERPNALLSALHANIVAIWAKRLGGTPIRVVICEQNTFSIRNRELGRCYSRLMLRFVRSFYPWANGIVAVSKGVAEDLAQIAKIPPKNIQVIYNPVITNELKAKGQVSIDHPWFGPDQPPVILGVGRLTAQKDFGTLIQAFAQVRKKRMIRLLILGEGEKRGELEDLVMQLNLGRDVSFPGFVSNPHPYMARASLFVLSSRWEGLPLVLVEALYWGARIIATDCPSGPREILKGGKYGHLVPVGDVSSLAIAIESQLESSVPPRLRESWQPFELETVLNQYMNVLVGK